MSGAVVDPDLEQAIEDLGFTVRRIQQIEDMLIQPDHVKRYPQLAAMLEERADLRGAIKTRADKLALDPRALSLMVIEGERARSRAPGRRPVPLNKLLNIVSIASEIASRERAEANADLIAAQERAKSLTAKSSGFAKAVEYLEACRS